MTNRAYHKHKLEQLIDIDSLFTCCMQGGRIGQVNLADTLFDTSFDTNPVQQRET
jgi:hypothetical protein